MSKVNSAVVAVNWRGGADGAEVIIGETFISWNITCDSIVRCSDDLNLSPAYQSEPVSSPCTQIQQRREGQRVERGALAP